MPVISQPLRKRCNVQLRVITCLSDNISDDIVLITDESPTRGRQRIRQRKMTATRKDSAPALRKGEVSVTLPSLPPLPRLRENYHLQSYCELVPFLSIALSDGSFDPTTLLPQTTSASTVPFTHVIKIKYPTPILNPGLAWSEHHFETGTAVLNLIIPTPDRQQEQTLLTKHQLLLSRDFLSLALPYYCLSEPPIWVDELPSADMVHVLITAPPGPLGCTMGSSCVVDVMSIVACYLTFAGGESAAKVVEYVDGKMDTFRTGLKDVWKGRIKGDGIKVIQKVANAY